MSSLFQSSRTLASLVKKCDCGLPSPMKISSTPVNYGRKFHGYGKFDLIGRRGCKYFEWVDSAYLGTENYGDLNE